MVPTISQADSKYFPLNFSLKHFRYINLNYDHNRADRNDEYDSASKNILAGVCTHRLYSLAISS